MIAFFRNTDRSIVAVTTFMLLAGFLLTYWAGDSSVTSSTKALEDDNRRRVQNLEKVLDERFVSYKGVLTGAVGLINANSGQITAEQWTAFASAQRLSEQFPAIESVGYVENIDGKSLVVYIEPDVAKSRIGFDMLTEPKRAEAMNQARETGKATISGLFDTKSRTKAVVIVYPLYAQPDAPPETAKHNTKGYVYIGISLNRLFAYVQDQTSLKNAEFAISEDGMLDKNDYVYKTAHFDTSKELDRRIVNVYGKRWIIHSVMDIESAAYRRARYQPAFTVGFFLVLTLVFTGFLAQILRSRARRLDLAKQLELQKSRDGLLALASHQLRTPATSVKQYLGMVLEGYAGTIDKKQRKLLTRAYTSNERQLDLVNQILHISRIEAGRLELSAEPVNVGKLARKVIADYRQIIRDNKQTIKYDFDKKTPLVSGDPVYLTMVIENLLSNASKYTPEKGSISIRIYPNASGVILEISDTGVGIDKEDLEQLFQKFSRIHNELSISAGGTGIGLYLSKLVVELHGGTIEAISHRSVGTTFRVKLPREAT